MLKATLQVPTNPTDFQHSLPLANGVPLVVIVPSIVYAPCPMLLGTSIPMDPRWALIMVEIMIIMGPVGIAVVIDTVAVIRPITEIEDDEVPGMMSTIVIIHEILVIDGTITTVAGLAVTVVAVTGIGIEGKDDEIVSPERDLEIDPAGIGLENAIDLETSLLETDPETGPEIDLAIDQETDRGIGLWNVHVTAEIGNLAEGAGSIDPEVPDTVEVAAQATVARNELVPTVHRQRRGILLMKERTGARSRQSNQAHPPTIIEPRKAGNAEVEVAPGDGTERAERSDDTLVATVHRQVPRVAQSSRHHKYLTTTTLIAL